MAFMPLYNVVADRQILATTFCYRLAASGTIGCEVAVSAGICEILVSLIDADSVDDYVTKISHTRGPSRRQLAYS